MSWKKNDIRFLRVKDVNPEQRQELEAYYQEMVFPVLTPMAVDAARPFPFLANKTLNIAVELRNKKGEQRVAFVQVPSVLPRFISLVEQEGKRSYIFLEDLIMEHCQDLFKGLTIVDMVPFRITRDSDLEVEGGRYPGPDEGNRTVPAEEETGGCGAAGNLHHRRPVPEGFPDPQPGPGTPGCV